MECGIWFHFGCEMKLDSLGNVKPKRTEQILIKLNIRLLWASTSTMLLIVAATILLGSVKGLDDCGLVTVTASSPASHYGTLTPYYGNETVWREYVTTGATCSTDGGTLANLQAVPWTKYDVKYRCSCRGSTYGTRTRFCTLHLWRCPKGARRVIPRNPIA